MLHKRGFLFILSLTMGYNNQYMDLDTIEKKLLNEEAINNRLLHLTANEASMSHTARRLMNTKLDERYYFGKGDAEGVIDFQPSTYLELRGVRELVEVAEGSLRAMLGAVEVNLGCLSGVHAMMCAILAVTEPGDTVMSVGLDHGGHFATKQIIERTGRKHVPTVYDFQAQKLNHVAIAQSFEATNATALYLDTSFWIAPHNIKELRSMLGSEVTIIYDASHTAGLIMGGLFQDPFVEGVDVICANTHKTLPGPQKGIIAFGNRELANKANAIINSGLFSSPHTGALIGLAITILEMEKYGKAYAKSVVRNANALGESLADLGFRVRRTNTGKYSENHQIHLFTEEMGNYRDIYRALISNDIYTNFSNTLGGDMFMRIGVQELTRRGLKAVHMRDIARCIKASVAGIDCRREVQGLIGIMDTVRYSFDIEARLNGQD